MREKADVIVNDNHLCSTKGEAPPNNQDFRHRAKVEGSLVSSAGPTRFVYDAKIQIRGMQKTLPTLS